MTSTPRHPLGDVAARAIEGIQRTSRLLERARLASCRYWFQTTGNPLFVWRALDLAASTQLPTPRWALDFLSQRAPLLLEAAAAADGDAPTAIARALGFQVGQRGRGGELEEYRRWERRWRLFVAFETRRAESISDESDERLYAELGEAEGIGADAVRKDLRACRAENVTLRELAGRAQRRDSNRG